MRALLLTLVLGLVLALVAGCGDKAADDTADATPPIDSCTDADADGDGVDGADCGGLDCDDADPEIAPGLEDPYGDGIDQDCDGRDGVDADGDGATAEEGDCADDDDSVGPHATDVAGDGVDLDCDGVDGVDDDRDGYASEESGGDDCDDDDRDIHPGVSEQTHVEVAAFATRADVVATRVVLDDTTFVVLAAVDDGACRVVDVAADTTRLDGACAFAAAPDGAGDAVVAGVDSAGAVVVDPVGTVDADPADPALVVMAPQGPIVGWVAADGDLRTQRVGATGQPDVWPTAGAEALALSPDGRTVAFRVGAELRALTTGATTPTTLATDAVAGPVDVATGSSGPLVAYACDAGVCVVDGTAPWTVDSDTAVVDDLALVVTDAGSALLAWSDGEDVQLRVRPVGSSTTWIPVPVAQGTAVDLRVGRGEALLSFAHGGQVWEGAIDVPDGIDDDCDGEAW